MSKKIPYTLRSVIALTVKGEEAAWQEIQNGMSEISSEINDLVAKYDKGDYPLVIAAMRLMAQALYEAIDEEGQQLADGIQEQTLYAAVNLTELKRRMKKEG